VWAWRCLRSCRGGRARRGRRGGLAGVGPVGGVVDLVHGEVAVGRMQRPRSPRRSPSVGRRWDDDPMDDRTDIDTVDDGDLHGVGTDEVAGHRDRHGPRQDLAGLALRDRAGVQRLHVDRAGSTARRPPHPRRWRALLARAAAAMATNPSRHSLGRLPPAPSPPCRPERPPSANGWAAASSTAAASGVSRYCPHRARPLPSRSAKSATVDPRGVAHQDQDQQRRAPRSHSSCNDLNGAADRHPHRRTSASGAAIADDDTALACFGE